MTTNSADILYSATTGSATSTPAPAPAPRASEPVDEASAAEFLFGAGAADDDKDIAPKTQGGESLDKVFHPVQREIVANAVERFGLAEDEAIQSAQAWATVFRNADVTVTEASALTEIATATLANGVDESTALQWRLDAQAAVKAEFGATHQLALADAQAYIRSQPKLAAWLVETGLGDHPRFVLAACRKGRALRAAGRT